MSYNLDVEVCQKIDSLLSENEISQIVRAELNKMDEIDLNMNISVENWSNDMIMINHVSSITCFCSNTQATEVNIKECSSIRLFVYRLTQEDVATETMQSDSEDLAVASHWILPSQEFHGLWENLCYDTNIKDNLLRYIETTILFSDRNVNPNIITWNKVVLLHGPPGTGKTSLCKALAQKATIRLGKRFTRGELVEINSHSLFSKWFSESGKLVMKLFTELKVLLEDPQALICILIDEVESLAHARKSCMNGTEPSDSIRVVNALLTQLDQMKRYNNVLILTTSNITAAIDLAFVDRADIKQYIGNPGEDAIFSIYHTCLKELIRTGFIKDEKIFDWKCHLRDSNLLRESVGLSGRSLRKVPFIAHALYTNGSQACEISEFLSAMKKVVRDHKENDIDI